MDRLLEQSLLYDFYGELLTEHQRSVYEAFAFEDLSLGEIAEQEGISRQGVHDLVKRCEAALQGYEERLHLVERFGRMKAGLAEIQALAGGTRTGRKSDPPVPSEAERLQRIRVITERLYEEL